HGQKEKREGREQGASLRRPVPLVLRKADTTKNIVGRSRQEPPTPVCAGSVMKGTVHAAIGASTPIGLILTQHVSPLQGATMAAVSAGFSLLPDAECEKATADRALGGVFHKPVHRLCAWVYDATATPADARNAQWRLIRKWKDPYHRTLTHTLLAVLTLGMLTYTIAIS